ncbi:hypothetical protein CDL15_Pgr007524 [Punica granatum]|uniref:Uncharacterized protein n=1 Tax=Punica granatum TaxID=22663 RepID=A0A218X9X4_PUNGR|nr:hypothetical protein CDL15_Pgr007524 [Punica granatum]
MNHKRKYLLNRSQEYQLEYLLSKEESFQQYRPFIPLPSTISSSCHASDIKKIPIKPITRIPVRVPIIQRGILPVVSAIYPASLHHFIKLSC